LAGRLSVSPDSFTRRLTPQSSKEDCGVSTVRVLLADDNPAFTRAAKSFLNSQPNLEVVASAASAVEAMDLVATLKPDLILMDVVMPGMSGLDATRLIKQGVDAPKIIILTLHKAVAYRIKADAVGADGFITKDNLVTELPPLIGSLFVGSRQESDQANGG
jgi:DNA-binding NarL/FixJ family response regulator